MRILHTMLRVGNLDKSIAFYTQVLGMSLLRQKDYPRGEFTLAFLGYGPESEHPALELTYNWTKHEYKIGTGFGHIAINVEDVYEAVDKAKKQGATVTREAGPMSAGTTIVGFLQDPDGYEIELLSKKFE
ncbi:lactoylglutathione lyase [Candidatus Thioglobus sp.]|jgi:lactoylglutathione lyase|uniref:lactoylglutathione lyase n=1 Tax=Candidatus Thioglobus sp. TaxID=2026721 RepID=UPI001D872996|nr:lactoylglutathione lyase [Candidatus Thioglobus sp.]MBT3276701.1 lactoylglutathione lyase [Candidatus Thioglobus sp.]MBT3447052.1 lactoylglutathione lyase [Candidatus Thioglobus sp.]MBT3745117.1 lactoylglutathione lyase [Candidatus Thioglobus sp.]MBT4000947.1 lactoylglutathione lyase [Candidatus Thioglobus sp.]MBT4746890.1 lactoylglutathione lyase [Candidatus Thioglobus sp.]